MTERILQYVEAGVPVVLWGPPGVGKTSTIYHIGKKLGIHVETLIASIHEPVDFSGWPVVVDGKVRMAPPPWLERLRQHEKSILFLDEITNVPPAVQAALLRVILERVVGDEPLPENVYVMAAANPPEMATDGVPLRPPLANRLAHLEFQLDAADWAQQFPVYWGDPPNIRVPESQWLRARSLVAGFIRRRPDLLLKMPNDEDQAGRAWPSPRSWDAASRLMALHIDKRAESWSECVASCVGEGVAVEFISWAKRADLPDPEQVLTDPESVAIPDEADRQFALVGAVTAAVQGTLTEPRWQALGTLIRRIADAGSQDIANLAMMQYIQLMRELQRTNPRVQVPRAILDSIKDLHYRTGLLEPLSGGAQWSGHRN